MASKLALCRPLPGSLLSLAWGMHEMSIAQSLLELAEAEARANGCARLISIRVEYGAISGVMPEALRLCFQALVAETRHAGASLELQEIPLKLQCPFCGAVFGGAGQDSLWEPCPGCGESFGHTVIQGRELLLSRIEAEKDV